MQWGGEAALVLLTLSCNLVHFCLWAIARSPIGPRDRQSARKRDSIDMKLLFSLIRGLELVVTIVALLYRVLALTSPGTEKAWCIWVGAGIAINTSPEVSK